ncbi:NAD(P)-dependent oxidoreductase, partial [Burkholderia pseudomallei]
RVKIDNLLTAESEGQASIVDGVKTSRLATEAAHGAHLAAPLLEVCCELSRETEALGHGQADMAAVVHAIEARSDAR